MPAALKLSASFRKAVAAGLLLTGAAGTSLAAAPPDHDGTVVTNYSQDLDALGKRFTERLQNIDPGSGRKIVFIDPTTFDSAVALGLAPAEAIQKILEIEKVSTPDLDSIAQNMSGLAVHSQFTGNISLKTNPHASVAPQEICAITPADPSGMLATQNLTLLDMEAYTNYHEAWHCLDSQYNIAAPPLDTLLVVARNIPQEIIRSGDALSLISKINKAETFSDLGAAGDMIREGYAIDIVDRIAEWRSNRATDYIHFTGPGLMALKERINAMGIDKFRLLQEQELEKLYYNVTDMHAFSPEKMKSFIVYTQAPPAKRVSMLARGDIDPSIRFNGMIRQAFEAGETSPTASPEEIKHIKTALAGWNAEKMLKDEAMRVDGKATPQSIVNAYGRLQDQLRESLKSDPHNLFYPEQLTLLKDSLSVTVAKAAQTQKPAGPKI